MISLLRGTILSRTSNDILLDVNGVGYQIFVSKSYNHEAGYDGRIYTYLDVKENSLQLFGFSDEREREIFKMLISVNGIGPKIAHTILCHAEFKEIIDMILNNGQTTVKIPGLGPKKVETICVALKDKIFKFEGIERGKSGSAEGNTQGNFKYDAMLALVNLGYAKIDAEKIIREVTKEDTFTKTEDIIRKALQLITSK